MSFPRNVAALATPKTALDALLQAAAAAFALEGIAIDRQAQGFESALFMARTGVATGAPDSLSVAWKLQDSAINSGDWVDVVADGINPLVAGTTITAETTAKYLAIDLSRLRRYVRLVFTVAFVGGSTPKVNLFAIAMLGGQVSIPPTHS